jgi:G3E family GTPase
LNRWPVPKKDILDLEFLKEVRAEGSVDVFGKSLADNPFVGVLRSKGFSWLAPSSWTGLIEDTWRHDTAMYLSHAGRHMSIDTAGKWWASIPQEQMEFFFDEDNKVEKERILREDFVSEEFGDRRQELVFIGMGIDQEAITNALNECLLTDEEMQTYRQQLSNIEQMMLSAQTSSVGLLDTEGTQHIDQVA